MKAFTYERARTPAEAAAAAARHPGSRFIAGGLRACIGFNLCSMFDQCLPGMGQ